MKITFGALVEGHIEYQLTVRKLTPRTIIDMRCSYKKVAEFCLAQNPQKEIWQLSLSEYTKWINHLRDQKQTTKSINKMLSHLRGLIDYAWQLERVDRNVLSGFFIKEEEKCVSFDSLSIEEAKVLMAAFSNKNKEERRNRMILLLLYGCGLRTNELCQLNVTSINQERQELTVLGKGSKQRAIPVSDRLFTELLGYLNDRNSSKGALFKTRVKNARVSSKDILDIVQVAVKRAALTKSITPKTFRHAFASHLLDQGVDISVISILMGHRSPKETGVYIHALEERIRATVFEMKEQKEVIK